MPRPGYRGFTTCPERTAVCGVNILEIMHQTIGSNAKTSQEADTSQSLSVMHHPLTLPIGLAKRLISTTLHLVTAPPPEINISPSE